MELSSLYCNQSRKFGPIDFVAGLNVVLAEIRVPENRMKDTHNLGKTTLARMIDFMLLEERAADFFLFKQERLFADFVFFLELKLADHGYVTIRRAVKAASKISFVRHEQSREDYSEAPPEEWDHWNLPFDRSTEVLDGMLDWRSFGRWKYRHGVGYFLRTQSDFDDVFRLGKFGRAKDIEWKPFLAHILGFDSKAVERHYEVVRELKELKTKEQTIQFELGGSVEDVSNIEGIWLLKQAEVAKRQKFLDEFDFRDQDADKTKDLVDEIDVEIAELNGRRYSLRNKRKKIQSALEGERIRFDTTAAAQLFEEAGVLFAGQLKKDFDQLIDFNRAVTAERAKYLRDELTEVESELRSLNADIDALGNKRSTILSFLSSTDVFAKYKTFADELVNLKAEIADLERRRAFLHRLQELRGELRALSDERRRLQAEIVDDVDKQNADKESLFSTIRLFFNEVVEAVIDRKALLRVTPNKDGHLEFKAEILDESGNATSADMGTTYRKLLCMAFDLAVLRAYRDVPFPRFVYHDGALEGLDDRKKENLLAVLREHADYGLQPIITLIDSDLPPCSDDAPVFDDSEIILRLHDEDESGRLFRMEAW